MIFINFIKKCYKNLFFHMPSMITLTIFSVCGMIQRKVQIVITSPSFLICTFVTTFFILIKALAGIRPNNLFHFNQSSCWDKAFTVLFQTFDQPKMWWGGVVTRQLEYRMGCCLGEKRAWVSIKRGSLTFF